MASVLARKAARAKPLVLIDGERGTRDALEHALRTHLPEAEVVVLRNLKQQHVFDLMAEAKVVVDWDMMGSERVVGKMRR